MKILYVSNYRNQSGYSEAARNYILAMDSVGLDVVPRHLNLLENTCEIDDRIAELEQKSEKGCNVVIQHTLPSMMVYDGRFDKNIGLFAWESSNFHKTGWKTPLNCMDEVWVINGHQKSACVLSGVKSEIRVVPHACNPSKYYTNHKKLSSLAHLYQNDAFIFYTIGEFNKRKNFGALLKAFHGEFHPGENVELVIKTSRNGQNHNLVFDELARLCTTIKEGLKLYKELSRYKKENIIVEQMPENMVGDLHYTGTCFVQTSYGEAWGYPAMDAMAFGKNVLLPSHTGFLEYNSSMDRISSIEGPCFATLDTDPNYYSANEEWYEVNIKDLRRKMRKMYELWKSDRAEFDKNGELNRVVIEKFSLDRIGKLIKTCLESQKPIG